MVHFDLPGRVKHMVCVDFRRKMVWNTVEREYPAELNPEALRLCCGLNLAKHVDVRVLEVVEQREKKEKKPVEVFEIG